MGKQAEERGVVLAVNGRRSEVAGGDPSTTLLEFLRTRTPFRGPKLGCGEGGCGACAVLISKYDPATDQVQDYSASSCLTLLRSLHLCSVTTSEGLGNTKDGFHAIHRRLAGFHASQCGFCTPGMCMSIFSALANADKAGGRPPPPDGFSRLTVAEAERAVAGNLCRCTGYRPIVDACKSFAADVDLEDLGLNVFWRSGEDDAGVRRLPGYVAGAVCTFPEFLKAEMRASPRAELAVSGTGWYCPGSIAELYELLNSQQFCGSCVKLVAGNTGAGVYKDEDLYDKYVDIRGIPELLAIESSRKGIEIGAATTISRAIEVLSNTADGGLVFGKLAGHMSKVASQFVRNTASIGGNMVMSQRYPFASDIATILLGAGANVCIQTASDKLRLTLEEFLKRPPIDAKTLLLSIFIPRWSSDHVVFETYRASPRPLGNAVAYANAAFLAKTSLDEATEGLVLDGLCLAFGAYGGRHAIRARKVEDFLKGKPVGASVLLDVVGLLRDAILPSEGTTHPEYRTSLAVSFLFSFLSPLARDLNGPGEHLLHGIGNADRGSRPNGGLNGPVDPSPDMFPSVDSSDMPLSSRQEMVFNKDYKPVGEPIKKAGAEIQASGEAVYIDDIPAPEDCLYGAFIYSTKPLAHVKNITFRPALASQKVITVITAKDIPSGGRNIGSSFLFGDEALFADAVAEFTGQSVGLVIAETQRYANMAAKQAIVEYSMDDLKQPILTVEQAVESSSYFEVPPFIAPKQVGDFSRGMAEADHKILSAEVKLDSQYYFYMETQTALAIPDEDNCITVYSSTQAPEGLQSVVATCLGLPYHNVRVITRRVGGGFGGKAFKAFHVATACAVAAYKLRRPVRMYMDRKTDMIMAGGRHPMKANYTVGFKSDGTITALHLDLRLNAGISPDVSPLLPGAVITALKKYNWGALSFDIRVCKTNQSSKSAMRAPGDVQGSFIAEAVVEHVSSTLALGTNAVRRKNLHDFQSLVAYYEEGAGTAPTYTLPSIFDRLASSPEYQRRASLVERFNSDNRWRKRGISCVPVTYEVTLRPTPGKVSILNDGSIVVEVGGIEIGQGLWTKVKQMAAFALGRLWGGGGGDGGLLDNVRVVQADTLSLIQGGITGGSTTSETSCEAVRQSCIALVDRLRPVKERLEAQMGRVTWSSLVSQASQENVNLSASAYWTPDPDFKRYLNYGAAVSEVEVDLLTGATTILRSDLAYDCGQSLNPAVDLGQVEGAFVQGIGFFMYEEYATNSDGLVVNDGTWTYKVPTVDTIPKQFNVELLNSAPDQKRVLSSKASGEPPLLLAASVHCAMREAIRAARKEFRAVSAAGCSPRTFQMDVPATMPIVKELCGLDIVERYLEGLSAHQSTLKA